MEEHVHSEDPQGATSQLSGPTQQEGNQQQIDKQLKREFLEQVERDAIKFSRKEAEAAGRTYGGLYPNLISASVCITTVKKFSSNFANKVADPGELAIGPRIVFFTDGSVHENYCEGGGGITFKRLPSISPQWTDFGVAIRGITRSEEAELVAIDHALQLTLSDEHGAQATSNLGGALPVYIFTDSLGSLSKLRNYLAAEPDSTDRKTQQYMHPAFINFIENLDRAVTKGADLRFCWVKAHMNVEGNERADTLAGTASKWFRGRHWPEEVNKPYAAFPIPVAEMNAEPGLVQNLIFHTARYSRPPVSTQSTLGKRKRESDEVHSEGEGVETRPKKTTARRWRKNQRKMAKRFGRLRLPNTPAAQPEPPNAEEVPSGTTEDAAPGTPEDAAPDIADGDGSTRVTEDAAMERYKRMLIDVLSEDFLDVEDAGKTR